MSGKKPPEDRMNVMNADEAWEPLARASRDALALLGYDYAPRCLPGEPDNAACRGGFADHVLAHMATIKAVADHHLSHLQAPGHLVEEIYAGIAAEIDCAKTCH